MTRSPVVIARRSEERRVKKTWSKPGLLVLVRGKPEEAVLTQCKFNPQTGSSSLSNHATCNYSGCTVCSSINSS